MKRETRKIFDALERYSLGNRGKNICFGVLGDLPDAKEMFTSRDADSIAYAEDRIEALNRRYGGGFCLFIRRRSPTTDGSFMGWERKRGAVIELSSLISGDPTTFDTVICDEAFLHDIKYIITLDADTRLPLGGALKLVSCMLHPSNKPVIRDGKVVEGHAILQPSWSLRPLTLRPARHFLLCVPEPAEPMYMQARRTTPIRRCSTGEASAVRVS